MATFGYGAEIDAGRRFLESIRPGETIVLLFHGDADGCCAAAIMYKTLRYMGDHIVFPVYMEKGENVYSDTLRKRVMAIGPSRLIVMDTGSRSREIMHGVRTMVIDHHAPDGIPPVEAFVTSFGADPPAPASLLTYQVCKDLGQLDGREWLAAIGTAADLGPDADFEVLKNARSLYGVSTIKDTVALINAARRSSAHDIAAAFGALVSADNPTVIAEGAVREAAILHDYWKEVNAVFRQVVRTPPTIQGQWALIKFGVPEQIHSLVATAYARRLTDNIVIAANYGYTEGKVHFSVRSAKNIDLQRELRSAFPAEAEADFAHGNPQATGGIMTVDRFEALLSALGFPPEIAKAA